MYPSVAIAEETNQARLLGDITAFVDCASSLRRRVTPERAATIERLRRSLQKGAHGLPAEFLDHVAVMVRAAEVLLTRGGDDHLVQLIADRAELASDLVVVDLSDG